MYALVLMDIRTIIRKLGGPVAAAKVSGLKRQTLETWAKNGRYPRFRERDVEHLASLAKATRKKAA